MTEIVLFAGGCVLKEKQSKVSNLSSRDPYRGKQRELPAAYVIDSMSV